eukprot:12565274-Prorocentrum_lima.AAC.1
MCIRDRKRRRFRGKLHQRAESTAITCVLSAWEGRPRAAQIVRRCCGRILAAFSSCLLYTSDAADDM